MLSLGGLRRRAGAVGSAGCGRALPMTGARVVLNRWAGSVVVFRGGVVALRAARLDPPVDPGHGLRPPTAVLGAVFGRARRGAAAGGGGAWWHDTVAVRSVVARRAGPGRCSMVCCHRRPFCRRGRVGPHLPAREKGCVESSALSSGRRSTS